MIRLIQHWNLYYTDDNRNTHKVVFQTWLNDNDGTKEYCIFKPPDKKKEIVTKERGNKYYYYLCKRYQVKVVKIT